MDAPSMEGSAATPASLSTRDRAILAASFLATFAGVGLGFLLQSGPAEEVPAVDWNMPAVLFVIAVPFTLLLVHGWPRLYRPLEKPVPRWGLLEGFLGLPFFFALTFVLGLPFALAVESIDLTEQEASALAHLVQSLAAAGTVAFAALLLVRRQGEFARPLGLVGADSVRAGFVSILGWILFLPAFFLTGAVVLLLHGLAGEAPQVQEALKELGAMRESGVDPFFLAAILVSTTVAAPIVEELLFRGLLHGALRRRLGPGPAIALSSAAFMAVHWPPGVWPQIFLLGVFLAWAYERSGSLWAPIAIHFANNAAVLAVTIGGILIKNA